MIIFFHKQCIGDLGNNNLETKCDIFSISSDIHLKMEEIVGNSKNSISTNEALRARVSSITWLSCNFLTTMNGYVTNILADKHTYCLN